MLNAIMAGQTTRKDSPTSPRAPPATNAANWSRLCAVASRDHHRQLLKMHLEVVAALEQAIADIDAAVGKALAPIRERARLLTTMPGVSDLTAQVIVAEIGVDMARFPTAGTSDLLGRAVSAQRRKCRQAPLHPRSKGRHLAQNRLGDGRLGRSAGQRLATCAPSSCASRPAAGPRRPSSPWPPPCSPPPTTCCGRRRIHRSRRGPLHPPRPYQNNRPPRPPTHRTGLPGSTHSTGRLNSRPEKELQTSQRQVCSDAISALSGGSSRALLLEASAPRSAAMGSP